MTSLTRGPLSAGVYWRRRLAVLGIALLLVVGLARMFGGGGDGDPKATPVSAPATGSAAPGATPTAGASPSVGPTTGATTGTTPGATPTAPTTPTPTAPTTLPAPTGRCSDDDIVVAPSVTDAQATRTVVVRLTLRTLTTTACTWRVSSKSVQLKITSGSDRIWSTVDCPHSVPTQDVVVRRDSDAVVGIPWTSRRSDADCSKHTQWAMPGYYHVVVAALGGEPQDLQFALRKPRPVVTPTKAPSSTPSSTPTGAASAGTPTSAGAPTTGARQEPQGTPTKKRTKKKRYVD